MDIVTDEAPGTADLNRALDSTPDNTESGPAEVASPQRISPALVSLGVHVGYDDNFRTREKASGSWFTDQQLSLAYDRTFKATVLSLFASVGAVERFGEQADKNASLDFSLVHSATKRLTLTANIDAAYRAEPDFTANIGPTRRSGNYFTTMDGLSAAYQWSERFSTVSSYALLLLRYEDSFTAAFIDRDEHTFGQEFRFSLSRGTILVGDYRFRLVDYVTAPQDSVTHFILAGVEQSFNSRLRAQARAGVTFRSIEDASAKADPEFEGSLDYLPGRHSTLSLNVRYSVEEATAVGTANQTTFRTGLVFQYAFTPRVSSSLGFYYNHDNQSTGASGPGGSFGNSDSYEFLLGCRYQINRHLDVDLGFEHTETDSSNALQNYSRNRYTVGFNISF